MAFTMTPAGIEDVIYTTRLTLRDFMKEELKKVSTFANFGNDGNAQALWRAFEAATNAGLMKASMVSKVVVSAQSTSITSSGQHFAGVAHVLILGFTRVHPLNAEITLNASFGIPAPVDAIVNQTDNIGKPIITRGIDFGTAANVVESTGAMVDFLEDALVYTDIEGTVHVGGWTYSEGASSLFSRPSIIDGVRNS